MVTPSQNSMSWPRFGQKLNQNEILVPIPSRIQARLDSAQAARVLGFSEHDIPILVRQGLLNPLGKPVPNATKYFAACQIVALAGDPKWLNAATQVIYEYWKGKNDRKTSNKRRDEPPASEVALAA
jgi:hypothetical protein